MNDEEYIFRETERERKRVARGSFNKVRGGGRHVRMPSDNLTKKEKEAMNGAVMSYDFSKVMEWKAFRKMPHDLQQQYLDTIVEKYNGVMNVLIGEAMGVPSNVFNPYIFKNGLHVKQTWSGKPDRKKFYQTDAGKRWLEWVGERNHDISKVAPAISEPVVEEKKDREPEAKRVEEPIVSAKSEVMKSVDISNLAVLLNALSGTGAELTIKIKL